MEPRTVLVTGASSGIGAACAERLARASWHVLAGVRRDEDRERLRRPNVEPVLLDVTDAAQIAAAASHAVDALVNNAGIAVSAPLELLPIDELRRQLEVNVTGQVAVTQALLPRLRQTRGRIVFIGSIGGRSSMPFLGAYSASKFALEAICDSLRVEMRPFGVEVSIVEPATISTPIWTKGAQTAEQIARTWPPGAAEPYSRAIGAFRAAAAAAGRRGQPADEVAKAVEHALTAARPRTRYLVGRDARRRARLERLPDRLRDRVLVRALRLT